jgi:hypothetical protein
MRILSAALLVLTVFSSIADAAPRRIHRRRRFVRVIYVTRPAPATAGRSANVVDGVERAPLERLRAAPPRVASESAPMMTAPARTEPRPKEAPPPARLELPPIPASAMPPPPARQRLIISAPAPTDKEQPSRVRYDLMAGGLAMFVAGWGADIGATYAFNANHPTRSLIPVGGAVIQMFDRYGYDGPGLSSGNATSDTQSDRQLVHYNRQVDVGVKVALGLDVASQVVGIGLAILGPVLSLRHKHAAAGSDGKMHASVKPTGDGLAVTF